MGKTKKGNANAQRNNNAKGYNEEFASYAETEVKKMNSKKEK
ncbi:MULTISPECIES: hypothetical protein [Metabacillus]|nr:MULTISPECIES: hypothetical protein [Metabacillus]MDX8291708.1 hypothetical protein [Metabacillus indicus]